MKRIAIKIVASLLVIIMMINLAACGKSSDNKPISVDTNDSNKGKLESFVDDLSDVISEKTENAKEAVSQLSLPDFKQGFNTAASFFGSTVASLGGQTYVDSVASAISDLETRIANRVHSGSIQSNAGNIAEEWHAGTYNIDAVASGKKGLAVTDQSNKLGSADISIGDDVQASLKYYQSASKSASEQAKHYIKRYSEYANSTENPMDIEDWLASNGINITDDSELFWSIYKDQIRIIPSDQLDDAIKCLEKTIAKESSKSGANRQYLVDTDLETLQHLTDRLKTSDGVESIPLSKEEAEAIAKAAQEGDFTAADFGVTVGGSITGSYIAKQAVKAGATSAIIDAALVLGPEIYEIIKYGIENGELDEEQLKNAGIDGLSAGADGFLKGSISNALVVMCKAGKLGAEYTNAQPELIGALTVLVIDGIRYGIMMSNGKLSMSDYIDIMTEEVVVSAGTLGATALVDLLFPGATLAILIGGFVGGLVVSAGYAVGKTYVLALIQDDGVDLLVPIEESAEVIKGLKETAKIKVSKAIEALKNLGSDTKKNITIKVYDLTAQMQI